MITYIANLLISPIGNISFQVRAIFSFFHTECLNKQVLISRKLFDIENFHSKDKKANVLFMFYQEKEFLAVTFIPVCIVNMPNRSREQPISWNQNSFLKTLFRKKSTFLNFLHFSKSISLKWIVVTLKQCIFDPIMEVKPKCVWEAADYINYQQFCSLFNNFLKTCHLSNACWIFSNIGSKMHGFRVKRMSHFSLR